MHYVTRFNYFRSIDRLARSSDDKPKLNEAIAGLSRFSLRDILNNEEIVNLYQHKSTLEIIKRWADSGAQIDSVAIREHLYIRERFFEPKYVLKVNTPRFHSKQECEFLMASFDNFETPPEITQLGPDKVSEFQAFCDKEWPRYKDKPIDVFWAHIGSHFRVSINPKEISFASQEEAEGVKSQSAADVEKEIHKAAESLRGYVRSNELGGYLYAPAKTLYTRHKDSELDVARRNAFLELLKLKKAIKMLVFNFHRIELEMPEGLLSDELLGALGFLPCKACCSNR